VNRIVPYWKNEISRALIKNKEVLVAAHGNSLRGIVKYLKNMGEDEIIQFNIPTGIPYIFEFDDRLNLIKDYFIGDPEEIRKLMEQVANQAKRK
jgi:2,3-bisphosphoglycerate-dependent phosphoglycerate mutase